MCIYVPRKINGYTFLLFFFSAILFLRKITSRGRTYVMITYVSKENNLGPDDKIRYIWCLKGPIFIL